ncbi:helicase [Ethanoligenens harbinense]|uniref:Helicase domain protein n=1 Tax=Ethanoligenens harbinense (strain DSM 18485 / JCM 12961 / CGMCC 1.5033 / YUAN-3) TaxID=663278 RepID=E6U5Q2_ETHHY|nr:helicase [Ethanoligenens harbinense]ADU26811.1 helicase domain protein [Ethanoligenens harbinense YUAN-3]AVQ95917.1 hypothetical protein CXQ68_06525 [Ethanoligenens harbinense YUAN-3]AYF38579.1 hypothetical protein CXP51_06395 [Ethanoligenens harbinense]AYF41325.1 hypothetical protein CN246_06530 [Ethanoligenens harbinense]QCN92158.1 hypothetical protein DRA42_06550 [Ethanoligenens harbinense]
MGGYKEYYDAISEIRSCLKRDLIGAVEENEVLVNVEPLNTYACGILWARRLDQPAVDSSQLTFDDVELLSEEVEPEDITESNDDSISNANKRKPISMGISITLPQQVHTLTLRFKGAKYTHDEERKMVPIERKNPETGEKEVIERERVVHRYTRVPFEVNPQVTVQKRLGMKQVFQDKKLGFEITLSVRHIMDDGCKLVTITATNIVSAAQVGIEQNINAIFQCELTISSDEKFIPVYQNSAIIADEEEKISGLQYRNVKNYAYGHGCSVEYDETEIGVFSVRSEFMPTQMVYQMMPGTINNAKILNLDYWTTADKNIACKELQEFINEYASWKKKQESISVPLTLNNKADSQTVLNRVDECIKRLNAGVSTLLANDKAWRAFGLMNEAMLLQRIKTKEIKPEDVNWYPFQLAYILQILPDIVNKDSDYRQSVDLLWFPTGGGKTEAYLGVAAFTILYRRLTVSSSIDGVTVIMRYTLRLLTIQQFERASALICACEYIRRRDNISGGEISIGLWIGSSMTPNHITEAESVLQKLKENPNEKIYEGNPVQITRCPWCGQKIDLNGYEIVDGEMRISCADNETCDFHKGLPIYVVDDDIYSNRSTLLLSTIDKFARITWEERARNLFGMNCPAPELIIQDELHLISGPLGSLSGIYEIAIEYLCEKSGKQPKIIASTATVRNAKEQIKNLYNRNAIQFPPAGINFDDSFFAVQADASKRPARTYLGFCEMGGSISDLLIRLYATLFFTKALFIKQGKNTDIIDQYFTTVGYFNALKDLGASSTIIQDRIFTHIRNLIARTFKTESEQYGISANDVKMFEHSELTSRKSSKEIKDTLDQLTIPYTDSACFSYILASNMLSVGIDIDRLGVMTVYNQPKSNAEYIQATSRVGRRNPGLVLTMYNNMRSRDKSHYEQFGYYHKSFYRYVEATSVTPFSVRAIEKALHCVFVALVRATVPNLAANDAARYFRADNFAVIQIKEYLVQRVREIMPDSVAFAQTSLGEFAQKWQDVAEENENTLYYKSYNGNPSLLSSAEEDSELGLPKILNSLRNVDPTVNIYFNRR